MSHAPRLTARVLALVVAALAACDTGAAQPSAQSTGQPQAFEYVEVLTGGARSTDRLPLIVGLHGRGDSPEGFAGLFDGLATPARVVLPRPPHRWGSGYAWYLDGRQSTASRTRIARELVAHAARLRVTVEAIVRARPTHGRPVVTGFSQGAMLSYTVAVTEPTTFAAAYPIGGFFFRETPRTTRVAATSAPRVVAWHGTQDRMVPISDDRRGIEALRARGITVDLREYPAPHTITPEVRAQLFSLLGTGSP